MLPNKDFDEKLIFDLMQDEKSSHMNNYRKEKIIEISEALAPQRAAWRQKNAYFHEEDLRYLKFLIPEGARILEIGCGNGDVLSALNPSYGLGVDISPAMIAEAKKMHPECNFICGDIEGSDILNSIQGDFDFILVLDTIGFLDDIQKFLSSLNGLCKKDTRIVVGYFSHLWLPILKIAEAFSLRNPVPQVTSLSMPDIAGMAYLSDLDVVKAEARLICPIELFGLGRFLNRFIATLPIINKFTLRHYTVLRSIKNEETLFNSATVVIPARNERGNIAPAIDRLPKFANDIEVIFVEGHSQDETWQEILRVQKLYPEIDIKAMQQPGKGKADAVFHAFDRARGDVLMILDADLTMPPEQLPKFWDAILSGKAEFVNGSRLIYPMESEAMRFLNLIANRGFSLIFSWLLNQRITDTLCGTKVISRSDYLRLKKGRSYFGNFDPFGDFDLIFGASKLNLKIVDVPVRYANRAYGETQISRFRHGVMLLQMAAFAFLRMKAL